MTKDKSSEIHIGESIVKSSDFEKVLGIKIDLKLLFCKIYVKKVTENCQY